MTFLATLLIPGLYAATITVGAGPSYDWGTIQDAIDAAADGDVIEVAAGTYAEHIDFSGKDVAIQATGSVSRTVLTATGTGALVTARRGESAASLEGFTLVTAGGRAISVTGSSPTVADCAITSAGTAASGQGGAIYVSGGAPTFDGLTLSDNAAASGGDLYVTGAADVLLSNTTISGSRATYGGSLYVSGASLTLVSVSAEDTAATYSGGFAYLTDADLDATDLQITDPAGSLTWGTGIFAWNRSGITWVGGGVSGAAATSHASGYTGGGLMLRGASTLDARDLDLEDNLAYAGGAIDLQEGSTATLADCRFSDNEADDHGGAVAISGTSSVSCDACTFDGNVAPEGGAVDVGSDALFVDVGGRYEDNSATAGDGGAILVGDDGDVSLTGTTCEGNQASLSGGALAVDQPGTALVEVGAASFTSNRAVAGDGGAVAIGDDASLSVDGCRFENNAAGLGWGGAVAFAPDSASHDLQVSASVFESNSSDDGGGAILARDGGAVTVLDSQFLRNTSGGDGGGLHLDGNATVTLRRDLLHENAADDLGGAVYETGTSRASETTSCVFSENLAASGAGLALAGLAIQAAVVNDNFVANDASAHGAHLYLASASVSFVNDIAILAVDGGGLYAASATDAAASDFYYGDVWGNSGGDYAGMLTDPVGTSGNISSDPILASYSLDGDETNDDHHLGLGSPCLDAGSPSITDVDGTRSDIGAYGGPEADSADLDADGYWDITDCDDGDASIFPGAAETPYDGIDQDCDGADLTDVDGDGWEAPDVGGADCDDEDPAVYPGAPETWYDGVDADCGGEDDYDQDADGFRALGWGQDCDDLDPTVHPGAPDAWYDGRDSDCGGNSDYDADRDGRDDVGYGGDDCDDTDARIFPGALEIPYDGLDQDCDGADIRDLDQDGWDAVMVGGSDCDDGNADAHPGAPDDPYDGVDTDCDGFSDFDLDHDGYVPITFGGLDCDDTDPMVSPEAVEIWYDGVDQDCDGHSDYDADFDGWDSDLWGGEDCDDAHADAHPGAPEVWYDGVDQACDGGDDFDQDADGYRWSMFYGEDADCDDLNAGVYPGALEQLNGIDDDCDGFTERDDRDGDGLADWFEWCLGTDFLNPDSDGDGWRDGAEVPSPISPPDTDADGVIDPLDDDDDGDGIPTRTEQQTDIDDDQVWDVDVDADGIPNGLDRDADGDSYLDRDEGLADRDRDDVPDYLDYTGDYAGGGCALLFGGSGGGASLAGFLLVGGLLRRRRGAGGWTALLGLLLGTVALAPAARAEEVVADRMDVRGFWVADTSGDPDRAVRLAYPSSGSGWDAGLLVEAAHNPLVEILPDGRVPIVDLMTSMHAYGGISWRAMRFDLSVPVTLYGHDLQGGFAAMGDAGAGLNLPALRPRGYRPGLGVAAWGWLPTGTATRWSGSPGLAAGAVATLAQEIGPFGWTLNAGLRVARADEARNLTTGPGPLGGLDLHYRVTDAFAVGAGAVVQGTTGFSEWPLEADARVRYRVRGGGFAVVGVATGLTDGVGASGLRGYAGVGYGRRRSDWRPATIEIPTPTVISEVTIQPGDLAFGEQPLAFLAQDRIVLREQIFFREARATLLPESEPVLEAVRAVLEAHPEVEHVLVEGHTNSRGGEAYNQDLSAARAATVVEWLAEHGIARARLLSKGHGEARPLVPEEHPDAMVVNRRVEFIVLRADETDDDQAAPDKEAVPAEAWRDR